MPVTLQAIGQAETKSAICREILCALPAWFGIAAAVEDYIRQVAGLPFWAAFEPGEGPGRAVGFVALRPHTAEAAEVCVMGVRAEWHRQGIGRQLVERCVAWCAQNGRRYLTVKTLADSHPDPGYAKTRQFYRALGFVPLEVFDSLWGPANPCLLMVREVRETPEPAARAHVPDAPKSLAPFLDGQGRLRQYPSKRGRQLEAIGYLAERLEGGRDYTEAGLNEALGAWHTFDDPCRLRRDMVDAGLLWRTPSGSAYRLTGQGCAGQDGTT